MNDTHHIHLQHYINEFHKHFCTLLRNDSIVGIWYTALLWDGRNQSSDTYLDARVRYFVPGDRLVLYEKFLSCATVL